MKSFSKVVALMVVLGLAGFAVGAGARKAGGAKAPKAPAALKGTIVSIAADPDKADQSKIVVKSGGRNAAAEATILADANTQITVDGQAGKIADLKAGQRVSITPASGTATKIEATAAKAAAKAGGAKAGRAGKAGKAGA